MGIRQRWPGEVKGYPSSGIGLECLEEVRYKGNRAFPIIPYFRFRSYLTGALGCVSVMGRERNTELLMGMRPLNRSRPCSHQSTVKRSHALNGRIQWHHHFQCFSVSMRAGCPQTEMHPRKFGVGGKIARSTSHVYQLFFSYPLRLQQTSLLALINRQWLCFRLNATLSIYV